MKRLSILFLVAIMGVTFAACSNDTSDSSEVSDGLGFAESSDISLGESAPAVEVADSLTSKLSAAAGQYGLELVQFTENGLSIDYYQVSGIEDAAVQEKINNQLKEAALSQITDESGTVIATADSYGTSTVMLSNSELLSVVFTGTADTGGANPNEYFITLNLDPTTGEKISPLEDYVSINESFVEKLVMYPVNTERLTIGEAVQYINENQEETLTGLKTSTDDGYSSENFSYYTNNSIGVSVFVPHSIGSYVVFEIPIAALD